MKRIWLFFFLCIFVPSVGSAATVKLDIRLDFVATKTVHDCIAVGTPVYPNPGPGNCGLYQNINFGETLPSYLTISGAWDTVTGIIMRPFSSSCGFGSERCFLGGSYIPKLSFNNLSSLVFDTSGGDMNALFSFNLLTGTGQYLWEDDSAPFYSKGIFDLTNVRSVISTQVVPLPASLMLLPLGLLALVTVGRRGKRRYQ